MATDRLVWLDMEMSGLDVEKERILEIALIITDGDLNRVAVGPEIVVHQPDSILDSMSEWCTKHHNESGLTRRVRRSKVNEEQADIKILDFLKKHIPRGEAPLAGSSVHQDRLFMAKYLPLTNEYLHYRHVDVSSFKEMAIRWRPDVIERAPEKKFEHRALADIKESIEELRYYRDVFIRG